MNCLLLAGGFATRMYPLTKNMPKALLELKNKTILSYIVEDLCSTSYIQNIYLVVNHRFFQIFYDWLQSTEFRERVILVDNGATCAEESRGAALNILKAIETYNFTNELLIMGADNLLFFPISVFLSFYDRVQKSCVMWHGEKDLNRLRLTGVAQIINGTVVQMREKPHDPIWQCAIPPIYIYTQEALELIRHAEAEGCKMASTGSLLEWLTPKIEIAAMKMPGPRYDVGNLKTYYSLNSEARLVLYGEQVGKDIVL